MSVTLIIALPMPKKGTQLLFETHALPLRAVRGLRLNVPDFGLSP